MGGVELSFPSLSEVSAIMQAATPLADVAISNWSPAPLYARINGASPNDSSFVSCPLPPGGSFDVRLAPLAPPGGCAAPQTLTVRIEKTDAGVALVTFFLLQAGPGGVVTVAARSVTPTQAFVGYQLTLTQAEIDLITDYTNLRVRVLAGGPGTGSYGSAGSGSGGPVCPCPLSTTFTFTLSGLTGACAVMNGTWALVANLAPACEWFNTPSWGQIGLGLSNGSWLLGIVSNAGNAQYTASSLSCSGTSTMTLQSSSGCNWPATLTITGS